MQPRIIFVHGIWMKGFEMTYLRRYFRKKGHQTGRFSYRSLSRSLGDNATRLFHHLQADSQETLIVAHSLGGVMVRLMFEQHAAQLSQVLGVVSLGAPLRGSQVARFMSERRLMRWILGASDHSPLLTGVSPWNLSIPWFSIAGTKFQGVGRCTGALKEPGDGTVAIQETQLPGISETLHLPVSHTGMLFSRQVAVAIDGFIQKIR